MPPRCPSSAGFANCSADGMFGIHGGQEERRAMPDLMLYEAMKTRSTVHNAKEIEPIVHVFIGYSQISLRVLNLWRNTLQKKQQANILYKFIYIYTQRHTVGSSCQIEVHRELREDAPPLEITVAKAEEHELLRSLVSESEEGVRED